MCHLAEQERKWQERQQDRRLHEVYGSQFDILKWDKFVDSETGTIIYSDPESGDVKEFYQAEIEHGTIIIPPDEQKRRQAAKVKREQREYHVTNKKDKFVFVDSAIDLSDMPCKMVTRLIYLSTYAAFNTTKEDKNGKVINNKLGTPLLRNGIHLQRKDLTRVLGVKSERTVASFMEAVCPKFVCEDEAGGLYLVKDIFNRGGLKRKQFIQYQRIYNNSVRSLYEAANGKYHSWLGYVFMMIPYINLEYNILCWNPTETDRGKIQPMTPKQFCERIVYRNSNRNRLMNIYDSIMFDVGGKQEHFCKFTGSWNKQQDSIICINPNVIYAGTDEHRMDIMKLFFNENPGT